MRLAYGEPKTARVAEEEKGMNIRSSETVRKGSLIAYVNGVVSWYGPIDRFPSDRIVHEILVNPSNYDELKAAVAKENSRGQIRSN